MSADDDAFTEEWLLRRYGGFDMVDAARKRWELAIESGTGRLLRGLRPLLRGPLNDLCYPFDVAPLVTDPGPLDAKEP